MTVSSIDFYKMSGSGNDFIIVDNRDPWMNATDWMAAIPKICRRKLSVGADGFILVENSATADFRWCFVNSDGSLADMCGNGARCVARYACLKGITGSTLTFETRAGLIAAKVDGERVKIKMTASKNLNSAVDITMADTRTKLRVASINTGVPHVVIPVADVHAVDVVRLGREIRHHNRFAPQGTNVNFIAWRPDGGIDIRTYERGVEDETMACGTGAVAAALIAAHGHGKQSPVRLCPPSGRDLTVHFRHNGSGQYREIYLEGDARVIYTGSLSPAAWRY